MLDENEARALLRAAGETIPVAEPAAPLEPETPRRRWPYAAGAAAAALAIAASVLVGVTLSGDKKGADQAPAVQVPSRDELPLSPQHYELDDDQMPFLIGWKLEDARRELESRDLVVELREDPNYGCMSEASRVFHTQPEVGQPITRNGSVTLTVPGEVIDCVGEGYFDNDLALRLIDFAEGRGPLPDEVAGDLTLWLGNQFSRTITAEEAEDPAKWVVCSDNKIICGSALHDLVEFKYLQVNDQPQEPYISTEPGRGTGRTDDLLSEIDPDHAAPTLRGREAVKISYQIPTDGRFSFPSVDVFRTGDQVDAVATWTGLNMDGSAGVEVPVVSGREASLAWELLMDSGFGGSYDVVASDDCGEGLRGRALGTEPAGGTLVRPSTQLTLTLCRTTEIGPPPDDAQVGRDFLAAVDPHSTRHPSPFAEKLDLYVGNLKVKTLDPSQYDDPDAWIVCPPSGVYSEAECADTQAEASPETGIHALSARRYALAADPEGLEFTHIHPTFSPCATPATQDPQLPDQPLLVIGPADLDTCMKSWYVELYYNSDMKITAVNLLLGSP